MNEQMVVITFPGADDAEANVYARDLADFLRDEVPSDVKLEQKRTKPDTQDFGVTLVAVLGTAAVTALAKGIQAWLKGHTGVNVDIVTNRGQMIVKNAESKSAAEMVKAFTTES